MDFENISQIKDKIAEELQEVFSANEDNIEMECGDLLFAVVNLLRFLKVDGEVALNKSCAKFERRVKYMQNACDKNNLKLNELTADQQESLWQEAKENEDCRY